MNRRLALSMLASALVMLFVASSSRAQSNRTWVSGVGDDASPTCSRTAPCKTFAGALAKTNAGGEIDALDPGDFGRVSITGPITIDGQGVGRITGNPGGNAVQINAGAGDSVVLRGLSITGVGNSVFGVSFFSGLALRISDTYITTFANYGIDFEPASGSSELYLTNVAVENCGIGGALLKAAGPFPSLARIQGSRFLRNVTFGVDARDNMFVAITNSTASGNSHGFHAQGTTCEVNLVDCASSNNRTTGIRAASATATIRLSQSTVTGNVTGLQTASGGQIVSFGDNVVSGNTINGIPTTTVPKT
jgi:Right handed beta helix region